MSSRWWLKSQSTVIYIVTLKYASLPAQVQTLETKVNESKES